MHADDDAAMTRIVDRYGDLAGRYDVVVVVGSDYTDVSTGNEWADNARIAAQPRFARRPRRARPGTLAGRHRGCRRPAPATNWQASTPNRSPSSRTGSIRMTSTAVRELLERTGLPCGAIPEVPLLVAPTVADLQRAVGAELVRGNPEWLQRESLGLVIAAMSLPNVLTRLREDYTVIAPGDRSDVLPGLILAHQSGTFPHLSSVMLTGGYSPPEPVAQLIDGVQQDLPILLTRERDVRDRDHAGRRARQAHRRVQRSRSRPRCACSTSRWTPRPCWTRSTSRTPASSRR